MTRVDELDLPAAVVAHGGSAPWLGALIRTTDPLTPNGLHAFGRFDYPGGTQYVYITTLTSGERGGRSEGTAWIYRVEPSAPAKAPRRRASNVPGMSLPSEAVLTDDLALEVPADMLGIDRWRSSLR